MKNIEHKIVALKENYKVYCSNFSDGSGDGMSFADYVKRESENDPNFWFWLYDYEELPEEDVMKNDLESLLDV